MGRVSVMGRATQTVCRGEGRGAGYWGARSEAGPSLGSEDSSTPAHELSSSGLDSNMSAESLVLSILSFLEGGSPITSYISANMACMGLRQRMSRMTIINLLQSSYVRFLFNFVTIHYSIFLQIHLRTLNKPTSSVSLRSYSFAERCSDKRRRL